MPATVRITDNFVANLRSIEAFCVEYDATHAFEDVLSIVFDSMIPNLERFPGMGRRLLDREARSAQGVNLRELLLAVHADYEIREYLLSRHIALYAVREAVVYLLAIRDFRQASYDIQRIGDN